ncbi:hypothetical protein CJ030_MR5G025097 [Morella rubra]|uniref:Uncharacterized protein n=1 Tax=Morella rubra TaxID=262757 RepID=A0A6A1VHJ4_9ROSI|nr:hypothetical protein CJ030_MR5G025097 [Morella rubra]
MNHFSLLPSQIAQTTRSPFRIPREAPSTIRLEKLGRMGKSETQQGCTKHPNEKGLPRVCSACLRERLSQLYAFSN